MIDVLVIGGPTASGKTALAVELAAGLEGEIISADSRQVYRGLDAGTAKPTAEQRAKARHHLIDIIGPRQRYSAGMFARDAAPVAESLAKRGLTPIVCGGTGFYMRALLEPLFDEPEVPREAKDEMRRELRERFESRGARALHDELAAVDPESAGRLHPNDFQRVSRAIELYRLTGRTMTELMAESRGRNPFRPFRVVLEPDEKELKRKIHLRTGQMMDSGWEREVRDLLCSGVPQDAPGFESLGYREIIALVRGEIGRDEAVSEIDRLTWQYARRQRTWFRSRPARVRVNPAGADFDSLAAAWREFTDDGEK